ncbi:hypothetical protein D3C85_541650 [compost metagenome]
MIDLEDFYKMPKSLALADGYISKTTGEPVKLTASSKIIYTYMLSKTRFFTEVLNGKHFETQKTIAKFCGLEYKSTGAILRGFLEHGIIEGKKLRPNGEGQWRYHYFKVHSDIDLWEGGLDKFEIIKDNVKHKSVEQVEKPKQQPAVSNAYDPFDESDLPF